MDNYSYLNQISSKNSTKPATSKPSNSLLKKRNLRIFFIIAGALIVASIIFGIVMSILNRETDYIPRLKVRSTNLVQIISKYNPSVKSSSLRANGSSLNAVLTDTISSISPFISAEYQIPQNITKEETDISTAISTSLANAKINGLLDRTYARQLAYDISIIISLEDEAIKNTTNASAKSALSSSKENLEKLLPAFTDFSDTAK